ncbi:phosphoglycerate kinase [Petroclostridium sp. X23]|uniref:phosphoglycerate kinase n=1 Tax=Petroclostridium sp. X23 TaxID=3045146 RepID=UPI0024ADE3E3|nr:phosphoglycerate kinase [Petroclostridium sp. X23]WHH60895.1 phosphoglycerate kinase [Petroclostridium sp. X23]
MKFGICTLDDFELKGKTVLCRIDINQPIDKVNNKLKDTTRIKACIPTIKELSDKGAKVVLLAHQGSDIEYKNYYTTQPHSEVLTELLGKKVKFIDDVCGPSARLEISKLNDGEILLLDNVRHMAEEMTLFETKLNLSLEEQSKTLVVQKLYPLADLFVCDAFAAAHRSQPTLCGFGQYLPSAIGRLFEEEFCVISSIMEAPKRPCIFILGGAKIADAFLMMNTVLDNGIADKVLTGGLVANIMLAAKNIDIGTSSMAFITKNNLSEFIDIAKNILKNHSEKIALPDDLAYIDNKRIEVGIDNLPDDSLLVDIGSQTAEAYKRTISEAATVFINGPMGVFEKDESEYGTKEIWHAIANSDAYSVLGGGDSITATNKYALEDSMSYICTGGGALIRFLTGEELPAVKALRDAAKKFPPTI